MIIKQPIQLTETEIFINQINMLYSMLKNNHNTLMSIWTKDDATKMEIITGLGTDAKSIFEASYTIQTLLKTFDSSYEVILPYKMVIVDGVRVKKMLNITFKQDGSVDEMSVIED